MTQNQRSPLMDTAARLEAALRQPVPPPPGGLTFGRARLLAAVAGQGAASGVFADVDRRLQTHRPQTRRPQTRRPQTRRPQTVQTRVGKVLSATIVSLAVVASLGRGVARAIRRRRLGRRARSEATHARES